MLVSHGGVFSDGTQSTTEGILLYGTLKQFRKYNRIALKLFKKQSNVILLKLILTGVFKTLLGGLCNILNNKR